MVTVEQEAITLAARTARLEALVDAEKVLRDMAAETHRWKNERSLLNLAADRIGRLK